MLLFSLSNYSRPWLPLNFSKYSFVFKKNVAIVFTKILLNSCYFSNCDIILGIDKYFIYRLSFSAFLNSIHNTGAFLKMFEYMY